MKATDATIINKRHSRMIILVGGKPGNQTLHYSYNSKKEGKCNEKND